MKVRPDEIYNCAPEWWGGLAFFRNEINAISLDGGKKK